MTLVRTIYRPNTYMQSHVNRHINFEEGYVNSAFHMGLRPEFALLCGMHPDNSYTPQGEKERWYIKTPAEHVADLVKNNAAMLSRLWNDRAAYERSVNGDERGTW